MREPLAPKWSPFVDELHRARASVTQILKTNLDLPSDVETAYAIQEAAIVRQGSDPRAWKIGAPSRSIQERIGFASPFAGPIFDEMRFVSGAAIDAALFSVQLFEPEVAVTLGRDLSGSASLDDAREAIASYHPALEVLSFRIADAINLGPTGLISDYGLNGGLVLGPPMPAGSENYWTLGLDTRINGKTIVRRAPPEPETDPALLILWLAHHLESRGRRLQARDVVTTGSQAGVLAYQVGDHIEADYGPAGSVSATIRHV